MRLGHLSPLRCRCFWWRFLALLLLAGGFAFHIVLPSVQVWRFRRALVRDDIATVRNLLFDDRYEMWVPVPDAPGFCYDVVTTFSSDQIVPVHLTELTASDVTRPTWFLSGQRQVELSTGLCLAFDRRGYKVGWSGSVLGNAVFGLLHWLELTERDAGENTAW